MVILRKRIDFNWIYSCIFCINDTTLIVSMRNIQLYFGKSPDESILYVFRNKVYFSFTIFILPWLIDADLSSPNWLKCYSIKARSCFSSNYLSIMLAAVTDVSFLPQKVIFVKFSLSEWNFSSLYIIMFMKSWVLWKDEVINLILKWFEYMLGSHKLSSLHLYIHHIKTVFWCRIAIFGFNPKKLTNFK